MFPLIDSAKYKLLGTNIYSHHLWWGFLLRSSKFEKYKKIYNNQIVKYKKCTKIILGKCNGQDAAFLIQNAFPTTADCFDHIHTSKGKPLYLHGTTAKLIADNLEYNLRLHKRGIALFYTDVDRIYDLMKEKLKKMM